MATCREIITDALEDLYARPMGDTPSAEEADRGLNRLKALYRGAVEAGCFGRVEEYFATEAYEAEEQQRVYTDGYTITLPTTITDACTGLERAPVDLAMIQVTNAGTDVQISIYDAHVGAWVRLDNLVLDDVAPLSERNRTGLASALAICLGPKFMKEAGNVTQAYAAAFRSFLSNRLSDPRTTTRAEFY